MVDIAADGLEDGKGLHELEHPNALALERLVALELLRTEHDAFGEMRYVIRPEGIKLSLDYIVREAVFDIVFDGRPGTRSRTKASREVSIHFQCMLMSWFIR